jgi:hypothetical protein
MMVQSGAADVVIAGGVESMSNIEYYSPDMRWGARSGNVRMYDRLDRGRERSQPVERFGKISGMIETAENLARDYGISRERPTPLPCAATSVPPMPGPLVAFPRSRPVRCRSARASLCCSARTRAFAPPPPWTAWPSCAC